MTALGFLLLALCILGFGLISARAQRSPVTPPMVFTAFGFLIGSGGLGLVAIHLDNEFMRLLAEVTLILILFTDASRIDLRQLRREHTIPVRLLAFGLPATILFGTAVGAWLLPGISLWEAALLAAILAPTDAALGQAVVSSPVVPVRIRQALNIESGLNDGIALPVVLVFFSIACGVETESLGYWLRFALLQVTLGPVVGVLTGYVGGKLVELGSRTGWMSKTFIDLSSLALALLAYSAAELIGGNGFIAAFCAGITLGNTSPAVCQLEEFAEAEGQLLTLLVFLAFGAVMVPPVVAHVTWPTVLYTVLILTLVRMIPVALSLGGTKLRPETLLFLGWFGPRGIASLLFALLVVDGAAPGRHEVVLTIVSTVVLVSIFAHGLTAVPGAAVYARRTQARKEQCPEEHRPVSEMPLRMR